MLVAEKGSWEAKRVGDVDDGRSEFHALLLCIYMCWGSSREVESSTGHVVLFTRSPFSLKNKNLTVFGSHSGCFSGVLI